MEYNDLELIKDIKDAIKKIKKLQKQKEMPTREGMIQALCDARITAFLEISTVEFVQGDTQFMLWEQFSDADLYRKLNQYQEGLAAFCISKVGVELFNRLLNEE
mgnify:CR=1 FL=1